MYTELELTRIKWQCRRGMKELDLMVQTFFDNEFLKLSDDDQKIFVKLLDESDLNLFRWLLRGETPATDDFKHIIDIMVEAHNKLQEQLNSLSRSGFDPGQHVDRSSSSLRTYCKKKDHL